MAETKPNVFVRFGKGIARFFRDGKAEVKKVVWPKPSTVFKNADRKSTRLNSSHSH